MQTTKSIIESILFRGYTLFVTITSVDVFLLEKKEEFDTEFLDIVEYVKNRLIKIPLTKSQWSIIGNDIYNFLIIRSNYEYDVISNKEIILDIINETLNELDDIFKISPDRFFSYELNVSLGPFSEKLEKDEIRYIFHDHIILDSYNLKNFRELKITLLNYFYKHLNEDVRQEFFDKIHTFLGANYRYLIGCWLIKMFFKNKSYSKYVNLTSYDNAVKFIESHNHDEEQAVNQLGLIIPDSFPTKRYFSSQGLAELYHSPCGKGFAKKFCQHELLKFKEFFIDVFGENQKSHETWDLILKNKESPMIEENLDKMWILYFRLVNDSIENIDATLEKFIATKPNYCDKTNKIIGTVEKSYSKMTKYEWSQPVVLMFFLGKTRFAITNKIYTPIKTGVSDTHKGKTYGFYYAETDIIIIKMPIEKLTTLSKGGVFFNMAKHISYHFRNEKFLIFHETLHSIQKALWGSCIYPYDINNSQEKIISIIDDDYRHINKIRTIARQIILHGMHNITEEDMHLWSEFLVVSRSYINKFLNKKPVMMMYVDQHTSLDKKGYQPFPEEYVHDELSFAEENCLHEIIKIEPIGDRFMATIEVDYNISRPAVVALDLVKIAMAIKPQDEAYDKEEYIVEILNSLPFFLIGEGLTRFLFPGVVSLYYEMLKKIEQKAIDTLRQRLVDASTKLSTNFVNKKLDNLNEKTIEPGVLEEKQIFANGNNLLISSSRKTYSVIYENDRGIFAARKTMGYLLPQLITHSLQGLGMLLRHLWYDLRSYQAIKTLPNKKVILEIAPEKTALTSLPKSEATASTDNRLALISTNILPITFEISATRIGSHPLTSAPLFHSHAVYSNPEGEASYVGSGILYGKEIPCRSEDGLRHNVLSGDGAFTVFTNHPEQLSDICETLPPTTTDICLHTASKTIPYGVLNGVRPGFERALQVYGGVSQSTSGWIGSLMYYGIYTLLLCIHKMQEIEPTETSSTASQLMRHVFTSLAMLLAFALLIRATGYLADRREQSGHKTQASLLRAVGHHANKLNYVNACTSLDGTAQTVTAIATGAVTEWVTSKVVGRLVH